MDKQSIKNILCTKKDIINKWVLNNIILVSETKVIDTVSQEVWWIIKKSDLKKLNEFLSDWKEISKEVEKECKKIGIVLLRVLSSISTWDIQNTFIVKLSNPWIALEFFLLDKLKRKNKENSKVDFEKWPIEFDSKKIDFISSYKFKYTTIKIWNQLTTSRRDRISIKSRDVRNAWKTLDKWKWLINKKNFSSKFIPDLLALFVINSETSRQINLWPLWKQNILKDAYLKWKDDGFKKWWPSLYLEERFQNELDLISVSYPKLVKEFLSFVKRWKLYTPCYYTKRFWEEWVCRIKYNSKNKEYRLNFFQIKNTKKEFLYSIKFFITDKLLKKISKNKG
jgi:hypothetical protein